MCFWSLLIIAGGEIRGCVVPQSGHARSPRAVDSCGGVQPGRVFWIPEWLLRDCFRQPDCLHFSLISEIYTTQQHTALNILLMYYSQCWGRVGFNAKHQIFIVITKNSQFYFKYIYFFNLSHSLVLKKEVRKLDVNKKWV